ncbi:hypothetical protein CO613_06760 [Lysobacteraceae bacterium NML07-0707]|nr:hypothetical protein CO613_06760 [Xanthomonadaceae bacterium NML07-0707]
MSVLNFLLPEFSDGIQAVFFLTFLFFVTLAASLQLVFAREKSWENRWKKGEGGADARFDIDHGSTMEIYHAIATRSELLKDIMPGMLLVIGLLGTFLGLGLALNSASSALQSSGEGVGAMSGDMMTMLQGLGTKFKTSTWGIIGYILLKGFDLFVRTDERRMMWVIGKVDEEMEKRKQMDLHARENRQKIWFENIDSAVNKVVSGFEVASASIMNSSRDAFGSLQSAIAEIKLELIEALGNVAAAVGKSEQSLGQKFAQVATESKKTSQAITGFVDGVSGTIDQMAGAAKGIAAGSEKISQSAAEFGGVVERFGSQFEKVLADVNDGLGSAIKDMSESASKTLAEGSEKLGSATLEISSALSGLSEDIKKTLDSVEKSIEESRKQQARAMGTFSSTTETLNENVEQATINAQGMQRSIENGLKSVADSGMQMKLIGERLQNIAKHLQGQPETFDKLLDVNRQIAVELRKLPEALEKKTSYGEEASEPKNKGKGERKYSNEHVQQLLEPDKK